MNNMSSKITSQIMVLAALTVFIAGSREALSAPPAAHPKAPAAKPAEKPAEKKEAAKTATTPEPVLENVIGVSPDELVNKPQEFVGKNVKFDGKFFAFTSLALDYKPAYRSSKTHLSFLILRP